MITWGFYMPRRRKNPIETYSLEPNQSGSEPINKDETPQQETIKPFTQVEDEQPQTVTTKRKAKTVRFRVNEEGAIQFDSEEQKNKLVASLLDEPEGKTLNLIEQAVAATAGNDDALITEEHASMFLDFLGLVERITIPPIATKLIKKQKIDFKGFHPVVIAATLKYSDEEKAKISPLLAEVANDELPEKVRQWIASIDKKYLLLGVMAQTVRGHFINAIKLQGQIDKTGGIPAMEHVIEITPETPLKENELNFSANDADIVTKAGDA